MKKFLVLLAMASSLFCSEIKEISAKEFDKVIKKKQLVVVDFFANWCAPCRKFFPILESLARQNPDVSFYKIDISKKKGEKLKDKFEVKTIPTLIFFKNGKQLYRVVGRLPEKDLLGVINIYKN